MTATDRLARPLSRSESPVCERAQLLAGQNRTKQNGTKRNRRRTKWNVIEWRCVRFPFDSWLKMTKRNGTVLNDIGNVYLTHTVLSPLLETFLASTVVQSSVKVLKLALVYLHIPLTNLSIPSSSLETVQ